MVKSVIYANCREVLFVCVCLHFLGCRKWPYVLFEEVINNEPAHIALYYLITSVNFVKLITKWRPQTFFSRSSGWRTVIADIIDNLRILKVALCTI